MASEDNIPRLVGQGRAGQMTDSAMEDFIVRALENDGREPESRDRDPADEIAMRWRVDRRGRGRVNFVTL